MDESKKLLTVIEHWVEHNESHLNDYRKWGQTAASLGLESVESEIEAAVEKLSQSNQHLRKALKTMESV
ncbi:MAG: hypothetical protein A2170_14945 [Deltaproteobacteria bacterium RBG_13_53_10]|nr:MAG: hypothetical protein A2170_14945 [Deltaproteobacteria bacterium RBG_13_53_10]